MPVFLRWLLRLGPLNPISVRLVQNGSRRTRHLYIRSAYLGVLIIVLLWTLLLKTQTGLSYRTLAEAGATTFTWIAYLQIGLICVLAPVFMAGAIAQEANPHTWEVLLTTPLGALQIVLGNLLGRLFFILALLAAGLPLFALTQYFGGVPGRSILMSYLVAGCAALLVGSIAIALSVSRLAGRRAVFAFYVAVVSYLAATAALDFWFRSLGKGAGPAGQGVTWFTAINPFLALHTLLNPSSYERAGIGTQSGLRALFLEHPVGTWCWGTVIMSLLLVGASAVTARMGGLAAMMGQEGGVPWYRRMLGLGAAGAEHRPPRAVWSNPIAWREAAARNATLGKMLARWSFVGAGGLFGLGLIIWYHRGGITTPEFQFTVLATVWAELAVTTLVAINMAATAVSREREDGTLDLLLTTPITPGLYLYGKLRGLIAYLLPMLAVPLGTLAAAGLYVLSDGLSREGGVMIPVKVSGPGGIVTINTPAVLPEAAIIAPLVLIPFIAFCVMTGLQWSLKSKGTIGAVVSTVGVVGVISAVIGLCGWNAGVGLGLVGAVLAALSPASLIYSLLYPASGLAATATSSGGLETARAALAIGSVLAAVVYTAVVYGMHKMMVDKFDRTVRELAGTA
ncbi:MAG: ABC transporter permease subunit [Phycisphaerales bacterium]|nr:ABC transporter permease subunit [Phycisphaerales bacterium]